MEKFSFPANIVFVILLLLLARYGYSRYHQRNTSYPPGPRPLPIIGNLYDIPKEKEWRVFADWGEKYGDIVHVSSLGRSFIVLNSYKAITDLLEHRSLIYSDRPHLVMAHELIQYFGTGIQRYGSVWRKHRRLYRKFMDTGNVNQYQAAQMAASQELQKRLLASPNDYQEHARFITANLVMGITYGLEFSNKFEHYGALSAEQGRVFTKSIRPGAFLVENLPWLKYLPHWMPGAGFKKWAAYGREVMRKSRDIPFDDVKAEFNKGNMRPSFVTNCLAELGTLNENDEDMVVVRDVAGSIFNAGADTTSATIEWFLLAMTLYPDVQTEAQNELDKIVGRGRIPQFEDRKDLPYVNALVKELFRCFTVTRTALPHFTTEDDVYKGYFIPARSTVIGNTWALMNDPIEYPDPSSFKPERFLPNKDGKVPRDPIAGGAFGFGRRICAGRYLADASIFIIVSSVLATLRINKAVGENGSEIDVKYALEPAPGFFSRPPFFPFRVESRSALTKIEGTLSTADSM